MREIAVVTIKFLPPLSRLIGTKQLQMEAAGNTIRQVLLDIAQEYPPFREAFFEEDGQPGDYYVCRLNQESIFDKNGWETKIEDGDELVLLTPIVGGAFSSPVL